MALTRNFKQTVIERVERDPAFAKALLNEAATLLLTQCDFESFASSVAKPPKPKAALRKLMARR